MSPHAHVGRFVVEVRGPDGWCRLPGEVELFEDANKAAGRLLRAGVPAVAIRQLEP